MTEQKKVASEVEVDYKSQLEITYIIIEFVTFRRLIVDNETNVRDNYIFLKDIITKCRQRNKYLKDEDIVFVCKSIPFKKFYKHINVDVDRCKDENFLGIYLD